jgi:hypothetical protein
MSRKIVLLSMVLGIASYAGADIPTTGLQLHLDASSLTGYSNGDTVANWQDLAGGDNSGTSTGTPTYVTNVLNGLPVIKIDGTSNRSGGTLPNSNDFYSIPTIANVKTIAMVFKPTSNTYYSWSAMMAGPTSDNYGWHGDTHWGNAYWDYAYSINSIQGAKVRVDGLAEFDGGRNGVDYDHFNVVTIQLAAGTPFDLAFLAHTARYNSTNVYGMEIAELLVYNQQLSASDLSGLTVTMGAKYGIAVVPEPMTLGLLGFGGLLALRRRSA